MPVTAEYHLPGLHVREHVVAVPLDWERPDRETIEVFVRELVDPERRRDDLPLLVYLQGGPGGECPRPVDRSGWIDEALATHRVVLADQRGTGRSTPIEAADLADHTDPEDAADHLAHFRADSIVRDLEHLRTTVFGGRRWAAFAQSYGGWITLAYLSQAPDGLSAAYVAGGIPGLPASAAEVYRRTFSRVEAKAAEYYRRYPQDVVAVTAIADRLAEGDVLLPDGDVLTIRRFQSLGIDFGMKPGFERMHWLVEKAFARPGRLSTSFLAECLSRSSSAGNPLFWTLQESIYGDGDNGPTAWAAQQERDRRPQFDPDRRPLLFTGEMAFPWMFEEVRLLRGFAPAVRALASRPSWSRLYDPERLAANEVPVAAAVYYDDMYVDAHLQFDTLSRLGSAQAWVTNELEHDGIGSGRVLTHLRELVRDRGGERR